MEEKSWTIVQFLDDKSVEAVPSGWVQGEFCHWPSLSQPKLQNSIRRSDPLNTCWPAHRVRIFRNATYGDYGKAREKARLAEDTSDLTTDAESQDFKRKRVQKILSTSGSSSEDSFLPNPPRPKIKQAPPATNINFKANDDSNNNLEVYMHSSDLDEASKDTDKGTLAKSNANDRPLHGNASNTVVPINDANLKILIDQNHVLRSIMTETLQEVRKIRTQMIDNARSGNGENDENIPFLSRFPDLTFPVNSEADLEKFNEILSNEDNFENAVREFSRLGGTSTYNFTKRLLTLLMSNDMAIKFSFQGRKGKKKFKDLTISRLVINSAERGRISQSRIEVEQTIALWLRRASDRKKNAK